MSRVDLARLRSLVTQDIADSCTRLGLRCAGRIALTATTAPEWLDVARDLRGLVTDADRDSERRAVAAAATRMVSGDPIDAAGLMAQLHGMDLDTYVVELSAVAS